MARLTGRRVDLEVGSVWGTAWADVAQMVERVLGKDEVSGSIPLTSSTALAGTILS